MADLNTEVTALKGVGTQRYAALKKLGIYTVADLLSHFPRGYDDRSVITPMSQLRPDSQACVRAMVTTEPSLSRLRGGLDIVKCKASDNFDSIDIVFFNQTYVKRQLIRGNTYVFCGKVTGVPARLSMTNPIFESEEDFGRKTGRIVPLYTLASGLTQNFMSSLIRSALSSVALPETLPEHILNRYKLCRAAYAFENIHFPENAARLSLARTRLIFEELFLLSCAMDRMRSRRDEGEGIVLEGPDISEFYAALPFTPTGAQKRAVSDALGDMLSGKVMNRLVQGDVGSGKTLVAAACAWYACRSGVQCAFMAPTEILARQHFDTLTKLLEPLGIRVGLLTGSMRAKQKRTMRDSLVLGLTDLVVGTHALISDGVDFYRLGLVITDEQHRFGVAQRAALGAKGALPHTLVMSATPIPRTLALLIYGDLDVSIIDELPPGRQRVDTFAVGEDMRLRIHKFIRRLVGEGRQVFIVCPAIEESEEHPTGMKTATEYAAELQSKILPEMRIACIHGRMKGSDRDAAMSAFASGDIDILVSTTVVEVGVDVPNAALMIIENAERFGLSQLHQLRGRVGRGEHKSYCVLFTDSDSRDAKARLEIMCKTNDGFKIAEEDLRIRGPGDFFGSRQHGLPEMHIADLCADTTILKSAREAAVELTATDPELSRPENKVLLSRIESMFDGRISDN